MRKIPIYICVILVLSFFAIHIANIVNISASEGSQGAVLGAYEESISALPQNMNIPKNTLPTNIDKMENYLPKKRSDTQTINLPVSAAIIVDGASGLNLYEKNIEQVLPIASITKLITILTFLDQSIDLGQYHKVTIKDIIQEGTKHIFPGEKIKVIDLLHASLIASDNSATMALVNESNITVGDFVELMNKKAVSLGLTNTRFYDPIGLHPGNASTANEIAKVAAIAFKNSLISEITQKRKYKFYANNKEERNIYSTNALLKNAKLDNLKLLGGKTGYTALAGYCFVGRFLDHNKHELISVILGANDQAARFDYTKDMLDWVHKNYQWQ